MTILEWYELLGITFLLGERLVGHGRKYRHSRFVEPKLQHRQVLLEQAHWFEDRASKLAAFYDQLGMMDNPDKRKLAELVSKLDEHDRKFAMKQDDLTVLRNWAARKGQECHDNADEAGRMADEWDTKFYPIKIYPLDACALLMEEERVATAHVNELGIVFRGFNSLDQPAAWWESLLDELKSHHIPSFYPHGKRMSVDVSGVNGGVRGVVYFTPNTVSLDEAITILEKRGIKVYDVRGIPSGS